MRAQRWMVAALGLAMLLAVSAVVWAQLPLEPPHDSGNSVTGAFEGWYKNDDGTFSILVGYYNRNLKEALDIPVGPQNHVDPGGPDLGQPTHFVPGRQWGVFTITVPKDFGDKKFTWTIVANKKSTVIPVNLNVLWEVSPFIEASGNTPPFLSFDEGGAWVQGPPRKVVKEYTASVSSPLTLTAWVADDGKGAGAAAAAGMRVRGAPMFLTWSKFRGPGDVTFEHVKPSLEKVETKSPATAPFVAKGTTTATFSKPGDYILEALANDLSGDGGRGFQCCWSTAQVKVVVKAGGL